MIAQNSIDWSAEWREKGLQEGRREGRRQGRREGRREGEAEGRRKGEAELLLRQARSLYGPLSPAIENRILGAEADKLLKWGERLVKSNSLEEIFARD